MAVGCLQPDQQQQPSSQVQKLLPANCEGCLGGWGECTVFVYRRGKRKGSSCGLFEKWTVSFSPLEMPLLFFFPFHVLQQYMIFMQSFLKYCAVFENELNPGSFPLYFFPLVTAQIH